MSELETIHRYWRAANYLAVGQIYLLDNPLLREPLRPEHVKPRLLGHWGTTPGLNFVYVHMNRVIRRRDVNAISVIGPGHGGPAAVANAYLEGTYSEVYPHVGRNEEGLRELFRQFSFPGGIPSHVAPETPGSIHEGGELGYSLSHAYGAAFDNPDLLVCCVVGDGEAETGPLATAWHGNKFLNPATDGAVLPILHLNGYKIANPTVLARIGKGELTSLLEGYGHTVHWVDGSDPVEMHERMAAVLDRVVSDIGDIQAVARQRPGRDRPRWPMIVLRTPKGWTGPREVDGLPAEGTWRSHQVPLAEVRTNPRHLGQLEDWLKSYRPAELFDESGALVAELAALAPAGTRRMSANPHANGGLLLQELDLPDFRDHAVTVGRPGVESSEATRVLGGFLAEVIVRNPALLPPVRSRRDGLEPVGRGVRRHRPRVGRRGAADRRPSRSERQGDGGAVGTSVPGMARGVLADRPARAAELVRSIHPHRRLDVQPAREMAEGHARDPVAPARVVAQLPPQLTCLATGSQWLLTPRSGVSRPRCEQEG